MQFVAEGFSPSSDAERDFVAQCRAASAATEFAAARMLGMSRKKLHAVIARHAIA